MQFLLTQVFFSRRSCCGIELTIHQGQLGLQRQKPCPATYIMDSSKTTNGVCRVSFVCLPRSALFLLYHMVYSKGICLLCLTDPVNSIQLATTHSCPRSLLCIDYTVGCHHSCYTYGNVWSTLCVWISYEYGRVNICAKKPVLSYERFMRS